MTKQADIVVVRLDTIPASAAMLSASEKQRASRFTFERDRKRFIAARATLRRLLAARLGVQPEEVELVYGQHGKPALGGQFANSGLRFNVSHCDDLAVYAFARGREVGVDVEAVRWFADADDVAARFFSDTENKAYAALDSLDKPSGFFNCWTRKEAFIKAIGDGLNHPLQSFDATRVSGWEIESFVPAPGFIAAVATEKP